MSASNGKRPVDSLSALRKWLTARTYALPVTAAVLGAALAFAAYRLDAVLQPLPGGGLRVPVVNARAFIGAAAGGTITATAVLFWVRGTLVQLTANEFSPRVLRWYLQDGFERVAMATLVGAFAFLASVLLLLPADAGAGAPLVSVTSAFVVATGVLLVIIATIANSVSATHASVILHTISERTRATLVANHPPAGAHDPPPPVPEGLDEGARVSPRAEGWVRDIDPRRLLRALPRHCVATLHVRVGDFVTPGDHLAIVSSPRGRTIPSGHVVDAVRRAVDVGASRAYRTDVELGFAELVDVALRALAPGAGEETTATETIRRLGSAVREVLLRDLPPVQWDGEEGRRVVQARYLTHADYVHRAFDDIRCMGARYPRVAVTLLETLGMLSREVRAAGLQEREMPVRRQAERVLAQVRAADLIDADRERVLAAARENGFA